MTRKSTPDEALNKVVSLFNNNGSRIFTIDQLKNFVYHAQIDLRISTDSIWRCINKLEEMGKFHKEEIPFVNDSRKVVKSYYRYIYGEPDKFQLIASLAKNSYYSHQTALYFLRIIKKESDVTYLSHEQTPKKDFKQNMKQENIDAAFEQSVRKPATTGIYLSKQIMLHNGKFTNHLGVVPHSSIQNIYHTDLERTLLDITVRPNYAGGVKAVLHIYKKVKHKLSVSGLIDLLDKVNYIYPYHQAVGYYLEEAGYNEVDIAPLRKKKKRFKFYLTHGIDNISYNPAWRIYVPKDI